MDMEKKLNQMGNDLITKGILLYIFLPLLTGYNYE